MGTGTVILIVAAAVALLGAGAWAFWRYYWFWRNPARTAPRGDHIVSPADGVVVYVQRVAPDEPVISCKQGVTASINDIARETLEQSKILIGIFMSPFGVHHNRAPLAATVEYSRQYPAVVAKNHHMGSMHWRTIIGKHPMYARSPHVVENNRATTLFRGEIRGRTVDCYVVQIGGGGVHGIDVDVPIGGRVAKGERFGMIRIGSQVDLIVADLEGLEVCVKPGDRVVAGETIMVDASKVAAAAEVETPDRETVAV